MSKLVQHLGWQHAEDESLDRNRANPTGTERRIPPLGRQDDNLAAGILGAGAAVEQPARDHTRDLMRQPALLPLQDPAQLQRPDATVGPVGQSVENLIVRLGKPSLAIELAGEVAHQVLMDRAVLQPDRHRGVRRGAGHLAHVVNAIRKRLTCQPQGAYS